MAISSLRVHCVNLFQVVPFSPAAGLLEWVEDTMPLSEYLIGRDRMSGAHARYNRSTDLAFFDCFRVMTRLRSVWFVPSLVLQSFYGSGTVTTLNVFSAPAACISQNGACCTQRLTENSPVTQIFQSGA